MSIDPIAEQKRIQGRAELRVKAMLYNICFIANQEPKTRFLIPMVTSFDFKNFETKLAEILEDISNDNQAP